MAEEEEARAAAVAAIAATTTNPKPPLPRVPEARVEPPQSSRAEAGMAAVPAEGTPVVHAEVAVTAARAMAAAAATRRARPMAMATTDLAAAAGVEDMAAEATEAGSPSNLLRNRERAATCPQLLSSKENS